MVKRKLDGAVDPTRLYLICEKSGGLHLVEPSLTVGWLTDKIWVRLGNLKACCRSKYPIFHFLAKLLHFLNYFDALLMLFSGKYCYKVAL